MSEEQIVGKPVSEGLTLQFQLEQPPRRPVALMENDDRCSA